MPTDAVQWLQLAFSITIIAFVGYRQFNTWTPAEVSGEANGTEIFSFAPPRSFTTMLWKFVAAASFHALALIVLYAVLVALLSTGAPAALKAVGLTNMVSKDDAWIVALLVVTGLTPLLPGIGDIERWLREELHRWAFIPIKAQEMALELALPTSRIRYEERFFTGEMKQKLMPGTHFTRADFVESDAATVAQKWCRLVYLNNRFQPVAKVGLTTARLKSPYVFQFEKDFRAVERDVKAFAEKSPELLRTADDDRCSDLLSRIDELQERLYLLMCCLAFAKSRTVERAVRQFELQYGITVGRVQLQMNPGPLNPMLDALMVMTIVVLVICVAFTVVSPHTSVRPVYWTISACLTHGAGLLVGWLTFSRRPLAVPASRSIHVEPVSRKLLLSCAVLAFVLATIPTFAVTFGNLLLHPAALPQSGISPTVPDVALRAFQRSWPWALLASVTAASTYLHLERSAAVPVTLRTCLRSGLLQAAANVCLSLLIMAVHTRASDAEAPNLLVNLHNPVLQLVLALTAAIGLVIGFFLPLVVRGYGRDRRAGLERYPVPVERMQATLMLNGQQLPVILREMSYSGSVLEIRDGAAAIELERQAVLMLCDQTAMRVFVVRKLGESEVPGQPSPVRCFAVSHLQNGGKVSTPPLAMVRKLAEFLRPVPGRAAT